MRKGWTETTLGKIVEIKKGKKPPALTSIAQGSNVYLTAEVLRGGSCEQFVSGDVLNRCVLLTGDESVLLWDGAGAGDVFKAQPGVLASTMSKIESIDTEQLNSEFLYTYLDFKRDEIKSSCRGTTVPHVSPEALRNLQFCLPTLPEQKRIVDVVSSVDAYIDSLEQQFDSARTARNAVLHDLLSAGGDEWAETTLGEIGLNGMFADGDWVESKDQDPAGEYRLLQLADVGDGVFLDKSNRWMNSEQFHRLRCTPLNPRDILIARMPDPIARACVVPFGLPTCATVVDVAILRCGGRFLPEFVVLVINDSAFRAEAQSLLTGTTRQRISRSNLAKIVCKIPSLTEQKRIVEIVSSMDEVIQSTEQAVVDAKALRSGLLSDLLSGNHEIPASYDSLLGAA